MTVAGRVNIADSISLAMQFIASFCWAVGALMNGLTSVGDALQFSAAFAWCIANGVTVLSMFVGAPQHNQIMLKNNKNFD